MKMGLPSSPGMPGISIFWTGSSRRSRFSSVCGSRTSPDTKASNSPKSSRSSNNCTETAPSSGFNAPRASARQGSMLLAQALVSRIGDGLDFGVLVETCNAVLAADPAGLIAAEWCVGAVARGAVDADEAGAQPLGHRESVIECSGHDVACQPIRTIVGDPHRIVFVVERNDDEHRPEDLFLGDGHRVVDIDEKRWLDKEPLVQPIGCLGTADKHPRALFDALLDIAPDAAALPIGDDGVAERSRILRVSRC